jgi:ketosteroid isomerase-like protein
MKKLTYLVVLLFSLATYAQKNKNGVIYDKHPGIDLISTLHQAMTDGDIEKAAELLDDDLRWLDGNTNNTEWGGKQTVLNNISWFKNYFDYVSFDDTEGAYPDMLEYKRSGNWVQSWVNVYAVHKITGFKLDHPVLRIYSLNDDSSKITGIIEYSNRLEFSRLGDSNTDRKNGVIYNSHENINSVRKAMYAYVNGDVERAMSFFHENASFNDINESKVMNQQEILARDAEIFADWNVDALDEVGYPDYFEYDYRDSKVVSSWWNFRMSRKTDGKKVILPIHFSDRFDNDGKIIRRTSYWNKTILD